MADKKITLGVSLDTTGIDATIKKLQQDISKLQAPAATTTTQKPGQPGQPLSTAPGAETFRSTLAAAQGQNQKNRDEKAALDITLRGLAQKERALAQIAKLEASSTGNKKQEAYYANERNKAEKDLNDLLSARQRLEKNISKAVGGTQPSGVATTVQASGVGQDKQIKPPTSLAGLGVALLGSPVVAGIASVIAAATAAENTRVLFSQSANRARVIETSAFNMQGQGGQRLDSFLSGGAAEEQMFNPQRLQAANIAQETFQKNLNSPFRALGHKKEWFNAVTGGAFGLTGEVGAEQRAEQAAIQAEQYEAIKQGPEGKMKTAIGGQYLKNYQRDLDFQRQMGLKTETFRGKFETPTGQFSGGFNGGVTDAGFTQEQGMGMAGQIMGAGGGTRGARGAATALQAERAFDLTNAGQVMGKLGGTLGTAELSKEALIKIFSEGTRIGVNNADFVEENRRFTEMAANVISQSGATSTADVSQVMSQFGKFFGGDKTAIGQAAGQSAYDTYRQMSIAQTGPTGTMRAAGMLTDPTISKLSAQSRAALFTIPIDQLRPDDPRIQAMAEEAGTSPEKLIEAQNKITGSSANKYKSSDLAIEKLKRVKEKYGMGISTKDMPQVFSPATAQAAREEAKRALGQAATLQTLEHPSEAQAKPGFGEAMSEALSAGKPGAAEGLMREEATKAKLGEKETGRPEDRTNQIQAEASKLSNQLFMSIKDSIVPAAAAAKDFADDVNKLTAAMRGGNTSQISAAINAFQNRTGTVIAPTTAPTAGAPSSGSGTQGGRPGGY